MKCGGASPTTRRFPRFPVRAPQAAAACSRLNWRDVSMGPGVTANCFHPGLVATGVNRNNGLLLNLGMTILRPVARSPEKGAETLVWLATAPPVATVSGASFYDPAQRPPSPEAQDMAPA